MSRIPQRHWTTREITELRLLSPQLSRPQLADHFHRSIYAIAFALHRFGVRARRSTAKVEERKAAAGTRIERMIDLMGTVARLRHKEEA